MILSGDGVIVLVVSFVFDFKFCRLCSQSGNTMNSSLNIWKLSIRNWRRITMILTEFSNSLHSAVKFWKLISFSQIFSTNDIYWALNRLSAGQEWNEVKTIKQKQKKKKLKKLLLTISWYYSAPSTHHWQIFPLK